MPPIQLRQLHETPSPSLTGRCANPTLVGGPMTKGRAPSGAGTATPRQRGPYLPGVGMSRKPLNLSDVQRDRAIGALLGTAAGDALGAGYTFGPPLPAVQSVGMIGGGSGPLGPGSGPMPRRRRSPSPRSALPARPSARRRRWTTSSSAGRGGRVTPRASASRPARSCSPPPQWGLNPCPHHEPEASAAARAVSALAHVDPDVGDACVLWCAAVRYAVLTGGLDVRIGLRHIDAERRQVWLERILKAERSSPGSSSSGLEHAVVAAVRSAIVITPSATAIRPTGARR